MPTRFGLADGERARVTTKRGSAVAVVEVTDTMLAGHITLPNGFGLGPGGSSDAVGVAPNELTVVRRSRLVRRHAAPQARPRPRRAGPGRPARWLD